MAINGKRPVRLTEKTRAFAYESLNHKYGKLTKQTPCVFLDDIENFESLTPLQQYDAALERIVRDAPIRICEGERVSGAATLGMALNYHGMPATYRGKTACYSVSHITVDFPTVVKKGIDSIRQLALESYEKYRGTEKEPFMGSCLHCIDCIDILRGRYLDALKDMPGYEQNYKNLLNVPFKPAQNFYEAVQSLWFTFAFLRLGGNWTGIGRIDWILGEYLDRDLETGAITLEEAREILAHFFIKGCEWICGEPTVSGDAQHYQNIVLAGVDPEGKEVTNAVTYLVLDIIEELGIGDFPTTVRINRNSPPELLKRVAEVIRLGGGVIAVYNEDLILESLTEYGYDIREARQFANDGCWEVQIPGKTWFSYCPFDSLEILQKKTLQSYEGDIEFADFETLYQAYKKNLAEKIDEIWIAVNRGETVRAHQKIRPCTAVSIFEQGCIENGLSYFHKGTPYKTRSPHIGGLPDTVNSLYAIQKLVFEEKKISFRELMEVLRNDWEGHEPLRQYVLNKYDYYGNDNDEVDQIAARIVSDFADICEQPAYDGWFFYVGGISTFGRQIDWSPNRIATPSGRKAHDVLAGNYSPTPGTDKEGATAIIRSYCKSDLKRMRTGAALDIRLLPKAVNGENGLQAIISLIKGFVALGGSFMQLDIADTELLKEAQAHPENFQTMSVRISGWNARFVTLNKQWQDMIIAQTGSDF